MKLSEIASWGNGFWMAIKQWLVKSLGFVEQQKKKQK
jgi:hypothetical protein